jgi:rare lipoprotein A
MIDTGSIYRGATLIAAVASLSACSATTWNNPPKQAATPSEQSAAVDLPRSKRGNPPFYEVYGVRYKVMNSSTAYKEQGVASWYGKKFHGRDTSSGERYDMYAMTAAHKTLPLPTNVRVTNLENGKSVILRVNDRGPFVKNRLIDLSYAAAQELDVVANGTAVVEVVALNSAYNENAAVSQSQTASNSQNVKMYLQVGAFGEPGNAQKLADKLSDSGIPNVRVHEVSGGATKLFKVRIGPLASVADYDRLSADVERLQIGEGHLVVESGGTTQASRTIVNGG